MSILDFFVPKKSLALARVHDEVIYWLIYKIVFIDHCTKVKYVYQKRMVGIRHYLILSPIGLLCIPSTPKKMPPPLPPLAISSCCVRVSPLLLCSTKLRHSGGSKELACGYHGGCGGPQPSGSRFHRVLVAVFIGKNWIWEER